MHVKELFREFENTDDPREMKRIADEAIMELEIHARIEEEVFYPAIRRQVDDADEIMNEADEEHHVAKLIISELAGMDPRKEHFKAKFTVLAENVKHHIQEEESEMLPKAAEVGRDRLEELGNRMAQRKMELQRSYSGPQPEMLSSKGGAAPARGGSRGRASSNGRRSTTSRSTGSTSRSRSTSGARSTRSGSRSNERGGNRTTRRASTSRASATRRTPSRSASARGGTRSAGTRRATTTRRRSSTNSAGSRRRTSTRR
jgi:hypothetical protein